MKKWGVAVLCALLLFLQVGCAVQDGDYFAPFRGQFTATLQGEWQSVAFEAVLAADSPDERGARAMTLTFYAPSTLSGVVLTRDVTGALFLSKEGLSLPLGGTAATGYGALFDLFPTTGEVQHVTKENGNIRLDGAGFSLLFASDGTPLAAANASARVSVTAFEGCLCGGFWLVGDALTTPPPTPLVPRPSQGADKRVRT